MSDFPLKVFLQLYKDLVSILTIFYLAYWNGVFCNFYHIQAATSALLIAIMWPGKKCIVVIKLFIVLHSTEPSIDFLIKSSIVQFGLSSCDWDNWMQMEIIERQYSFVFVAFFVCELSEF